MNHILLTTPLSSDGLAVLQRADDVHLVQTTPQRQNILSALATAHALISGEDVPIDAALLDCAPHLRLVGRMGAALTDIDIDEATRRGVMIMNTPGVDAITVAEYTFGLILALARNLVGAHQGISNGNPDYAALRGQQLQGKTLGIIGLGRVGREIATRAIAFGMEVIAADPYVSESQVSDLRLKLLGLPEVFARADILTLHTSVIPPTFGLMNAENLGRMKPGALLVNVKDNQLMVAADVLAALESGQLGGLALDTIDDETTAFVNHPKVIHTARMRHNTFEAQRDLSVLIAQQALDALRGHDYRNVVNMPFMPGREYEVIAPKLLLVERIGRILHYLGRQAPIKRIAIETSGAEMEGLLKPLTVALLKGLLSPALGDHVNYINAPVLADEREIYITQAKGLEVGNYNNLFSCQVFWDGGGELVAAGSLFDQTEPRIVQLDRYKTDFVPAGTLLFMGGYDVPGVIGKVGMFMAENSINIAGWRTSRVEKGGKTLSVISIDEPLTDEQLNQLRALDFVRHATQISL